MTSTVPPSAATVHPWFREEGRPDPSDLRRLSGAEISELLRREMAGLSVSHYSALFRRATGYGALEYQTRLRMGTARDLLDTTGRPIASVAAQVGFSDPLYFSRQFHRIHGMSPTEYRSHDKG